MSPQLEKKTFSRNQLIDSTRTFDKPKVIIRNKKFTRTIIPNGAFCMVVSCLVLGLYCVSYVKCDIESRPIDSDFNDVLVPNNESVFSEDEVVIEADNINKSTNYDKFVRAFVASLSVILVSELGDKTFFIAAIMAMRHSRLIVFLGAISALALMTILSAVFGQLANFIPHIYTFYISIALFVIFGLQMLREGYYMSPKDAQEELKEVQSDLEKREDEFKRGAATSTTLSQDIEHGVMTVVDDPQVNVNTTTLPDSKAPKAKCFTSTITRVLFQAFTMTFVAEWGDRSQVTTIILAARDNVYGVTVGSLLGHAICTGLAVIGGRMIAQRISVRTVTIIGGIVFICFAISAFFIGPIEDEKPDIQP